MQLPQDWEGVARERMRSWEKEMHQRQLLAQIPQQTPRWRRWTGGGMVRTGNLLMRWGERMAQRECSEGVSVAG
jgi:hypothetical protein